MASMMTSSLGGSSLTSFNGVLSSGLGSMGAPPQQNRSSGPPRPQISEEDKAILQSQYETISAFIEENIAGLLPSIMATYDTAGVGYLDAKALSVFARDFLVANASVAGTQGEPPKQAIQGTVAAWHANLQMDPKNAATNVVSESQFVDLCKNLLGQGISTQPRAVLALFKTWNYEVTLPEYEKTAAQREAEATQTMIEEEIRPHIPTCLKNFGASGRGALGTVGFLGLLDATVAALNDIGAVKMSSNLGKVPQEHWESQLLSKNGEGQTVFNQSLACTIASGWGMAVMMNPNTRDNATALFAAWGLEVHMA